jgi:hypothetical protein
LGELKNVERGNINKRGGVKIISGPRAQIVGWLQSKFEKHTGSPTSEQEGQKVIKGLIRGGRLLLGSAEIKKLPKAKQVYCTTTPSRVGHKKCVGRATAQFFMS